MQKKLVLLIQQCIKKDTVLLFSSIQQYIKIGSEAESRPRTPKVNLPEDEVFANLYNRCSAKKILKRNFLVVSLTRKESTSHWLSTQKETRQSSSGPWVLPTLLINDH